MRWNYRSLLIILSFALIWAQNVVSVHDTVHILEHSYSHNHIAVGDHKHDHDRPHNHSSDDCVMCKIFKKGKDHVYDVTLVSLIEQNSNHNIYDFVQGNSFSQFRATASSRAPPLLISI